MATTKVEATKNQGKAPDVNKVQFKLDGTWYVVSDSSSADIKNNAKSGVTVKAVTVNGILFYAEKTSGSDSTSTLTDVALVVAKGTGVVASALSWHSLTAPPRLLTLATMLTAL